MLSGTAHPLQALADLLTIRQEFGALEGRTVTYVGDANNVARSLGIACGLARCSSVLRVPPGYEFATADLERIRSTGIEP